MPNPSMTQLRVQVPNVSNLPIRKNYVDAYRCLHCAMAMSVSNVVQQMAFPDLDMTWAGTPEVHGG